MSSFRCLLLQGRMKRAKRAVLRGPVACAVAVTLATAATAMAQEGHSIMQEVQRRAHSTSMRYEGTIQTCTSAKGCTAESKNLVTKRWIYERVGDFGKSKAMLRFTGPAEVKGVSMLIVNHPDSASDQWLWRPAVGRDQRVAIQDRDSRFFGTDFTFEDLEERDADQYDYTVTGEANGQWRIDAKPKKASEYTHSYFWVDKTNYVLMRIEAYNKKGLAKTIDYVDFQTVKCAGCVNGGILTAMGTLVYDSVRKTRTTLKFDKVDYNVPLKDEEFTVEALRRE